MSTTRSPAAAKMIAGLRKAGLKITPQRIAVVDAFADDDTHPTAQEIFERLRPAMPTMSFATVYSTLDTLAAANLCTARALSRGATRFDPMVAPHHHAICDRCGAMRDVLPKKRKSVDEGAIEGFHVRAVETIYRGLCSACAKKRA